MKAAVLHVNETRPDATTPTLRIARFVADTLDIPLFCRAEHIEEIYNTRCDVLFVKPGMLKFNNAREKLQHWVSKKVKHIIHLENDYSFAWDKRLGEVSETWSTCEGRDQYVNFNCITHNYGSGIELPIPFKPVRHKGLIYYGAYRKDRVPYFKRYFDKAPYDVTVSSFKGGKQFAEFGAETRGALKDRNEAANWQLTIYMEDKTSHDLYTSPATRFYECVEMGLAQAIDKRAVHTLEKAGFEVPAWFQCKDRLDIEAILEDRSWKDMRKKQRSMWYQDFTAVARKQLLKAVKRSGIKL